MRVHRPLGAPVTLGLALSSGKRASGRWPSGVDLEANEPVQFALSQAGKSSGGPGGAAACLQLSSKQSSHRAAGWMMDSARLCEESWGLGRLQRITEKKPVQFQQTGGKADSRNPAGRKALEPECLNLAAHGLTVIQAGPSHCDPDWLVLLCSILLVLTVFHTGWSYYASSWSVLPCSILVSPTVLHTGWSYCTPYWLVLLYSILVGPTVFQAGRSHCVPYWVGHASICNA